MKSWKRLISATIAFVVMAGIAACDGKTQLSDSSNSDLNTDLSEGGEASDERIKVRIFRSKAAHEVAVDQMEVFKVMGEKFNLEFEFDNPPIDNLAERLNLVMMEEELPDVIMDLPMTDVLKYGETGIILPLNDYINNSMPNVKSEIDKRVELRKP